MGFAYWIFNWVCNGVSDDVFDFIGGITSIPGNVPPDANRIRIMIVGHILRWKLWFFCLRGGQMEVFEKWKHKNYHPEHNLVDSDDYQDGYSDGLESGWEECLRWMEEAINSCMTVDDVQEVIDKELANKELE